MTPVALINPNTDKAITDRMVAVARAAAPSGLDILGMTAERGVSLIVDEAQLAGARDAMMALVPRLDGVEGVIVAAFGDPGLDDLRAACRGPVVGIGECALREAAETGQRFIVATTTPGLVAVIERAVARLGLAASFDGVVLTRGDASAVTEIPSLLLDELRRAIAGAARRGTGTVVIGGGPLADAARRLAAEASVVVVEPVPAAVRRIARLLGFAEAQGAPR